MMGFKKSAGYHSYIDLQPLHYLITMQLAASVRSLFPKYYIFRGKESTHKHTL